MHPVPPSDFSHLADNLRLCRLARRLTQRGLAVRSGLSQGYVCRLERHLWPSDAGHLDRLAKALGVEPRRLLQKSSFRRLVLRAETLEAIATTDTSPRDMNAAAPEGGSR